MADFREDAWEEGVELHETEQWARARKGISQAKGVGLGRKPGLLETG